MFKRAQKAQCKTKRVTVDAQTDTGRSELESSLLVALHTREPLVANCGIHAEYETYETWIKVVEGRADCCLWMQRKKILRTVLSIKVGLFPLIATLHFASGAAILVISTPQSPDFTLTPCTSSLEVAVAGNPLSTSTLPPSIHGATSVTHDTFPPRAIFQHYNAVLLPHPTPRYGSLTAPNPFLPYNGSATSPRIQSQDKQQVQSIRLLHVEACLCQGKHRCVVQELGVVECLDDWFRGRAWVKFPGLGGVVGSE
ncbi:hypothetical protein BJ508DRAFT_350271 [Ascobolus immersus RN42]|uniref:Uncharacterized protein n=1 Tax=Ascobolus immersus RN42 TaxID=1160509 RepID=A0A3N4IHQ3_ASCIM|nr:hypothetical protein BJ508DRAFT_350271 [Ascobolus immersus RN42]